MNRRTMLFPGFIESDYNPAEAYEDTGVVDAKEATSSEKKEELEAKMMSDVKRAEFSVQMFEEQLEDLNKKLEQDDLDEDQKFDLEKKHLWARRDIADATAQKWEVQAKQMKEFLPRRFEKGQTVIADVPEGGFGKWMIEGFDESTDSYAVKNSEGKTEQVSRLDLEIATSSVEIPGVGKMEGPIVKENDYIPGFGMVHEISGNAVHVTGHEQPLALQEVQDRVEEALTLIDSQEKLAQEALKERQDTMDAIGKMIAEHDKKKQESVSQQIASMDQAA